MKTADLLLLGGAAAAFYVLVYKPVKGAEDAAANLFNAPGQAVSGLEGLIGGGYDFIGNQAQQLDKTIRALLPGYTPIKIDPSFVSDPLKNLSANLANTQKIVASSLAVPAAVAQGLVQAPQAALITDAMQAAKVIPTSANYNAVAPTAYYPASNIVVRAGQGYSVAPEKVQSFITAPAPAPVASSSSTSVLSNPVINQAGAGASRLFNFINTGRAY